MHTRHAILVVCVLACGHAATRAAPAAAPVVLAGPTVPAESLRVAATDSLGVSLAQHLASGASVRVVSDRAALDFIDGGGDVLVTDRPSVIRYATSRADFAVIPLPWDRQYVLASTATPPTPEVLDAVHAEARLPRAQCADVFDGPTEPITYMAGDSIARSIAERFVGTGNATSGIPLGRTAFGEAIASNPNGRYLVTRSAGDTTCRIGALRAQPLIETRSQLIVRRGAIGVVADSAGGVRLETTP